MKMFHYEKGLTNTVAVGCSSPVFIGEADQSGICIFDPLSCTKCIDLVLGHGKAAKCGICCRWTILSLGQNDVLVHLQAVGPDNVDTTTSDKVLYFFRSESVEILVPNIGNQTDLVIVQRLDREMIIYIKVKVGVTTI
jgi:hypothetical protein